MQEVILYKSGGKLFESQGAALVYDFKMEKDALIRKVSMLSVFRSREQFKAVRDQYLALLKKFDEYREYFEHPKDTELPRIERKEQVDNLLREIIDLENPKPLEVA